MQACPMETQVASLESYFAPFRERTIGNDCTIQTPYGLKELCYADWMAGARLYRPIERYLSERIGPYMSSTYTKASATGAVISNAYSRARTLIKVHVNAAERDVLMMTGSGMSAAIDKLQHVMGFRLPTQLKKSLDLPVQHRPVVFITHMEHPANRDCWFETIAEVVPIASDAQGLVDLADLGEKLSRYADRKLKIASVSGGSNVTGLIPPYHAIAKIMHQHGGFCLVDFACSAPYLDIDMHPDDPLEALDAIFFSPHKFLGGPGSSGVLIFNPALYDCGVATRLAEFEAAALREDQGTPPFIQTIRAALSIRLKEAMGVSYISARQRQLLGHLFKRLDRIPGLHLLAAGHRERLGVLSFYIEGLHHELGVRILSDRFGIQVRGSAPCAGTYEHDLLQRHAARSASTSPSAQGAAPALPPGWIRLSIHPTMTDRVVGRIADALAALARHHPRWVRDYRPLAGGAGYEHRSGWDFSSPSSLCLTSKDTLI